MIRPKRAAPIMGPTWLIAAMSILLIALGVWTLPLGYFIGFVTSDYPDVVKLLIGSAAILAGIGVWRRRQWGFWLGIAYALTQLVGVSMPGFVYRNVLSLGFVFNFSVADQPIQLHLNLLSLFLILGLIPLTVSSMGPRRTPETRPHRGHG